MRLLALSLLCLWCVTACSLSQSPEAALPSVATFTPIPITLPATVVAQPTRVLAPTTPSPVVQFDSGCPAKTDWTATYTVVAGDTLFSIAQRTGSTVVDLAAVNCIGDAGQISVGQVLRVPQSISENTQPSGNGNLVYYLVSPTGDKGRIGVGCDGWLVAAPTGKPVTSDPAADLRASLTALLAMTSVNVGQSGLKNYFAGQGLTVADVTVQNGEATITINGTLTLIGVCADPQIEAQILLTVFDVPGVQQARITVGGRNMKQIFDMSGRTGADAVYVPGDVKRR